MKYNKYQTHLTDELLESLHQEVKDELFEAINTIEFIQKMISPNRTYAKDVERKDGKIIVDICNPHILEDMEYFRPIGNYFRRHGVITKLRPNPNPNSEFGKFIRQEINRIWHGMVRESDGEWVSGQLYFYLNYMPIVQSKIREGTKVADRIVDFPQMWDGVYLWFHYLDQARNGGKYNDFIGGQHAVQIAKRGASKSYSCASILARLFVIGDNKVSCEKTMGSIMAYDKEKLIKDGTLNKFVDAIDFCAEHTQFPAERLKDSLSDMHWMMGYKDADKGVNKGTENTILGVPIKDDPGKARGKRANALIYEEFGAFPGFLDVWRTNFRSVQEGNFSFGQAIAIGTGGSKGSHFAGAMEMLYNPSGYNVYALPNVFDKNSQGKTKSIFFFGGYMSRKGFYDDDGNSDVIGSLIEIIQERYISKYNTSDPATLTQAKAEDPITIQEAILQTESTIYPVADITDRLNELDFNPRSFDHILIGELSIRDGQIHYELTNKNLPIREFPHKDNKLAGAIEIHELPKKLKDGTVQRGRYISGIDTYDDDASETLSLGSIFILDLWTDEIVFEYTGRQLFAEDFYEICRRALLYYNAEANYENNKKGLFAHFSKFNSLYLLSDVLDFLKDKEMMKQGYGNKSKGTLSTAPIKGYGRSRAQQYLLKPVEITKEIDGEEQTVTVPRLSTMNSRGLLKELALWNPDGNFDRHDAFIMLMLIREDKLRLFGEKSPSESQSEGNSKYLGDDPFFTSNYNNNKGVNY